MKKALITFIFVLSMINAYCQCNVSKLTENGTKIIRHEQESIFERIDNTGGIAAYFEFLIRMLNDDNTAVSTIIIEVSTVGVYKMIVPRKLRFTFADLSSLELEAYSLFTPEYENGLSKQKSLYPLKPDEVKLLGIKSIKEIMIIDSRQSRSITCTPYQNLVSEQIKCVFNNL